MAENILDKILKTKQKEVAKLRGSVDEAELASKASDASPPRDFIAAVTKKPVRPVNLIAEIKKASPSKGLIREDFDPPALAKQYRIAGADAISVLTDVEYFQGNLAFIELVREVVEVPVIRKDFIIDPIQVYESRAAGADAMLLIAAALCREDLRELKSLATELGLGVLIEVHNARELDGVRETFRDDSEGWVLGINNRDLTTFNVDLNTTVDLCRDVPSNLSVVSESGIFTREDIDLVASAGASAVLVGESLMRSDDIPGAVERMLGPQVDAGEPR